MSYTTKIKQNIILVYNFFIFRWAPGLICLALAGSVGMTLVILACALQQYDSWWPFTVVLFYVLSVFPTIAARRFSQDSFTGTSPCLELSIFITMGFLISSFALPIVLNRAGEIKDGACYLTLGGNVVVYLTILAFFLIADNDNSYGGGF